MGYDKEYFRESVVTFTKEEVEKNCKNIIYPKAERYELYYSYFERDDGLYDKRPVMILNPAKMGRYYILEVTHTLKPIGTPGRQRLKDWEREGLGYKSELNFPNELQTVEKKWLRTYIGKVSIPDIQAIKPVLEKIGW